MVFDESRHITGVVSAPFVESMGTVVLLTSNNFLKWLVVLNVGLLLLVAMMVVPQKENWRHVFDLTKFNQRPNKLDPGSYRLRVKQALITKIRVHHDLTRDEMASKQPSEVQAMIGDPRLVELVYNESKTYSPQELRKMMQAIRRWGREIENWREDRMNATPPAKKDESPPDDVEAGYAKKAEAARGRRR